jgi:hypothetical protein
MTTKDKLIEKQREYIDFLQEFEGEYPYSEKLSTEISALEAEMAKEKDEPKMSARDILSKHGNWDVTGYAEWNVDCIIKAMEEYANQFKK